MAIKKAAGRPLKLNLKIVDKLAFYIQRSYSVSYACKQANISRDTYYRYIKTEPLFADSMATAQDNAKGVVFNFRTIP